MSALLSDQRTSRQISYCMKPNNRDAHRLISEIEKQLIADGVSIGKKFFLTMSVIVGNLSYGRDVGFDRNENKKPLSDYNPLNVTIRMVVKVMESLEGSGFVLLRKGFFSKENRSKNRNSRAIPTDKFLYLRNRCGLPEFSYTERGILLRDHPKYINGKKKKGKDLPLGDVSREVERLEQRVNKINESGVPIYCFTGYTTIRYENSVRMIFNVDYRHGGRIYPLGNSYQRLSESNRENIWFAGNGDGALVGGEWSAEPDWSASHVRLAYAKCGFNYDELGLGDPYVAESNGVRVSRKIGKVIVLIAMNCEDRKKAIGAIIRELKKREENGGDKVPGNLKELYDTFLEKHWRIKKFFGNGKDKGASLQRIEGEAVVNTILKLQHKGVKIVSIHDSVVTPRSRQDETIKCMEKELEKVLKRDKAMVIKGKVQRKEHGGGAVVFPLPSCLLLPTNGLYLVGRTPFCLIPERLFQASSISISRLRFKNLLRSLHGQTAENVPNSADFDHIFEMFFGTEKDPYCTFAEDSL